MIQNLKKVNESGDSSASEEEEEEEETDFFLENISILCQFVFKLTLMIFVIFSFWFLFFGFPGNAFSELLSREHEHRDSGTFRFIPGIRDYPDGNFISAIDRSGITDTLLFLYAPWDGDSVRSVPVLKYLSKIFQNSDLTISTVNCWIPSGLCKDIYYSEKDPFLSHYPYWVYLRKAGTSSHYLGGTRIQEVLSFIFGLQKSVQIISTSTELENLSASFGGDFVIGYFPFTIDPRPFVKRNYEVFRKLAEIMSVNRKTPGFGIVVNKTLANDLGLSSLRSVKRYSWNKYFYFKDSKLNQSGLASYILDTENQLASYFQISNFKKSFDLNKILKIHTITVLAFLKPEHAGNYDRGLSLLREISILLKSKNSSTPLYNRMMKKRISSEDILGDEEAFCPEILKYCRFSLKNKTSFPDFSMPRTSFRPNNDLKIELGASIKSIVRCNRLLMDSKRLGCMDLNRGWINDPLDSELVSDFTSYSGNKTVGFFVINALEDEGLALNLGLRSTEDVYVLMPSNEKQWKTSMPRLGNLLSNILYDRTTKTYFKTKENIDNCSNVNKKESCIPELTTSSFQRSKPSIILYQTISCYFCAEARRSLHEAKTFFEPLLGKELEFFTIDVSANDFPFGLSPATIPSFVFYYSTGEFVSYPQDALINYQDLVAFVIEKLPTYLLPPIQAFLCDIECLRTKKTELQFYQKGILLSKALESLNVALQTESHSSSVEFFRNYNQILSTLSL